jgi:hypothetical protein
MVGLFGKMAGGALAGLGEGMVEQAKQTGLSEREARLAEIRHGYAVDEMQQRSTLDLKRDEVRHGFDMEERRLSAGAGASNIQLQDKLARERLADQRAYDEKNRNSYSMVEDAEGRPFFIDRDGKPLAHPNQRVDIAGDRNATTLERTRTVEEGRNLRNDTDNQTMLERTDRQQGGMNLRKGVGGDQEDSTMMEIAKKRAEKEAIDRAGYLSSDSSDFADWGGDRASFTELRKQQIYQDLMQQKRGVSNNEEPKVGAPQAPPMPGAPPEAAAPPLDRLTPGKVTTFKNGQRWTVVNGKPQQVN